MTPTVWIVTPAKGRPRIARVVYAERDWLAYEMKKRGVNVRNLVIADDENLRLANERRFDWIAKPDYELGRRFNDCFEHAYHRGADYIVPAGNDDWIHPDFLTDLPTDGRVRCSMRPGIVKEDGSMLCDLKVRYSGGSGIRVFPRETFDDNPRIATDTARFAIDGTIRKNLRREGRPVKWENNEQLYMVVDFKSDNNIHTYSRIMRAHGADEHANPWERLIEAGYPESLVRSMYDAYR